MKPLIAMLIALCFVSLGAGALLSSWLAGPCESVEVSASWQNERLREAFERSDTSHCESVLGNLTCWTDSGISFTP